MDLPTSIYYKLLRWQNVYWRYKRLVFPSPAEMRFVELMGGRVVRVKWLRDPHTKFPLAVVVRYGRLFRNERVRREVGCGRYWIDFGNDIKRGIEIDGHPYHQDVVSEFDREVFLREHGWRLLRIGVSEMYRNPNLVQRQVLKFLAE